MPEKICPLTGEDCPWYCSLNEAIQSYAQILEETARENGRPATFRQILEQVGPDVRRYILYPSLQELARKTSQFLLFATCVKDKPKHT